MKAYFLVHTTASLWFGLFIALSTLGLRLVADTAVPAGNLLMGGHWWSLLTSAFFYVVACLFLSWCFMPFTFPPAYLSHKLLQRLGWTTWRTYLLGSILLGLLLALVLQQFVVSALNLLAAAQNPLQPPTAWQTSRLYLMHYTYCITSVLIFALCYWHGFYGNRRRPLSVPPALAS